MTAGDARERPEADEPLEPTTREHDPPPHDERADEPLGPFTPDDETPLGDSPELHDQISPHDLPKDHPGREAAEELASEEGGTTKGNR